jgi:hypothetical protein
VVVANIAPGVQSTSGMPFMARHPVLFVRDDGEKFVVVEFEMETGIGVGVPVRTTPFEQ